MGPNKETIQKEALVVKVDNSNTEEIRNKPNLSSVNGTVSCPAINVSTSSTYNVHGTSLLCSLDVPDKQCLERTNFKMPVQLSNCADKSKICNELCLLQKRFHNVSFIPLQYPLTNIAFELTIPKHIPLQSNKHITKIESNITLLKQTSPGSAVIPIIPILSSSFCIYEGVELLIPTTLPIVCKDKLSENSSTIQCGIEVNKTKNIIKNYSIKDTQLVSISVPLELEDNSICKTFDVDSSEPSTNYNKLFFNEKNPFVSGKKQKCKVEPIVRKPLCQNNTDIFNPNHKLLKQSPFYQNSTLLKQTSDSDNESFLDFSFEAEQLVSSICSSSPPKVLTKQDSIYSNDEIIHWDVDMNSINRQYKECNAVTDDACHKQKDFTDDWSKNATKYNLYKIFPNTGSSKISSNNKSSEKIKSFIQPCSVTNVKQDTSKVNQETLLFRAAALKGCYDMDNILKSMKSACTEIEKECNSVKKSIFAAINDVKGLNSFASDICFSCLQVLKSWIGFSSYFESSKFEDLFKEIDPIVIEYFKHWQYVTRIFMENMLKCVNTVNESDSSCSTNIDDFKNTFQSNTNGTLQKKKDRDTVLKDNFIFYSSKPQTEFTETIYVPKDFNFKSNSMKKINSNKGLEPSQFTTPDSNSSGCDKTQSTFYPKETYSNLTPSSNNKWPTTNVFEYSSNIVQEGNKTALLGSGDGFYKNCKGNFNTNLPNLVGPSYFTKESDYYIHSDQSISKSVVCNSPAVNFKDPFCNTVIPDFCCSTSPYIQNSKKIGNTTGHDVFGAHSNYKDHNILLNELKYNPSILPTAVNQHDPINSCTIPFYNSPLSVIGPSQPVMQYNQQIPIKNPIHVIDGESDSNSSYIRPGCYEPPQKPPGCLKPLHLNFPIEDTPIIGIPFVYSNRSKSQNIPLIHQSPNVQEINTNVNDKLDDTWKAALACAETLCETLLMKPSSGKKYNCAKMSESSTGSYLTSNGSNFCNKDSISTIITSEFRNDDWSIQSFSQPTYQNNTNKDFKLENLLVNEFALENKSFIKSSISIDKRSETDEEDLSFSDLREIYCKESDLSNPSSDEDVLKFKPDLNIKSINSSEINHLNQENSHNMSSLNNGIQLKISKKDLANDCVSCLSNKQNKTSFGWYNGKPRRSINRQTCSKFQDILDNIWKTDILKLLKNINNSKQELQNIEVKIKCPIFLQRITYRLHNRGYETTDQAFNDFQQFFHNIRNTNKDDETIVLITNKLEKIYNKLVEKHFGVEENVESKQCCFGPIGSTPSAKFRKQKKTYRKP